MREQRSLEPISLEDLRQLARVGLIELEGLYQRRPNTRENFSAKLFCLALCQGAALHYLDKRNGVKDFDVWAFYKRTGSAQFPYRWRGVADFGSSKFGQLLGFEHYVGRKVDVLGRSIPVRRDDTPQQAIIRYFHDSKNATPRYLAQKACILLYPDEFLGAIVWQGPVELIGRTGMRAGP